MDIISIISGFLSKILSGQPVLPPAQDSAPKSDPEPTPTPPQVAPTPASIDWDRMKTMLHGELGVKYVFGSKPDAKNPRPDSFDCSGLVHWAYGEVGITVPEGSQEQFDASDPVSKGNEKFGDVGFFRKPDSPTHHVGIIFDDVNVIEARGIEPSLEAQGLPDDQVILRPRAKWEAFSEFTGWRRFKAVKEIEG